MIREPLLARDSKNTEIHTSDIKIKKTVCKVTTKEKPMEMVPEGGLIQLTGLTSFSHSKQGTKSAGNVDLASPFDLTLTATAIESKQFEPLPLTDIVSVKLVHHEERLQIKVFTHPFVEPCCCGGSRARRQLHTYFAAKEGRFDVEADEVGQWKNWVKNAQRRVRGTPESEADDQPVLVLVNPCSGSGDAARRYKTKVAPYFAAVGLKTTVIETKHANHAKQIAHELPLGKYRGIVVASGDGLMYEVLQGLLTRTDWAKAIRYTQLGILPLGSGNGLSATINKEAGEPVGDLMSAAFVIARGGHNPLDIATIETNDGKKCYSFLSLEWALFADIDIESEVLRGCCGSNRFFFWGIWRIFCCMRRYHGTFSYLPAPDTLEDDAKDATSSSSPLYWRQHSPGPIAEEGKQDMAPLLPGPIVPPPVAATAAATKSSSAAAATKSADPDSGNSVRETGPPVDRTQCPQLAEPVPRSWRTLDSDFVQWWASNTKMQSQDPMEMAPKSEMDDGYMWVTANLTTCCCKMAQLALCSMPEGLHSDDPSCHIVRTSAFRLEPKGPAPPGILAVDGEKIPYGPVQCFVHRGLATVMSARKRQ